MVDERLTTFIGAVAVISDVVGYGIPYWIKLGDVRLGLWQACFHVSFFRHGKERVCTSDHALFDQGWYKATRITETIGLVLAVCSTFIIVFTNCINRKPLRYLAMLLSAGSAVMIGSGVIIFGVKQQEYLHASFGLAAVAAFLFIVLFFLLMCVKTK